MPRGKRAEDKRQRQETEDEGEGEEIKKGKGISPRGIMMDFLWIERRQTSPTGIWQIIKWKGETPS